MKFADEALLKAARDIAQNQARRMRADHKVTQEKRKGQSAVVKGGSPASSSIPPKQPKTKK